MGLLRGKIAWTIPGAGTAHSVLHFTTASGSAAVQADADNAASKIETFRVNIRTLIPSQVSMKTLSDIEEVNPADGSLIGVWGTAATTGQPGQASSTASWAAPVGAVITWNTAGVRNGRRVRGRTFCVPLSSTAFDTDGTLNSTAITTLDQAATALRSSTGAALFTVYARPTAPGATDGDDFTVLAHRVPDMGAILTSRRQ